MANYLDLAMPIVVKDDNGTFKATPYFEDYLFQIITSIGGEGAESIVDESSSLLIASLLSKVAKVEKELADFNQSASLLLSQNASLRSSLNGAIRNVDDRRYALLVS